MHRSLKEKTVGAVAGFGDVGGFGGRWKGCVCAEECRASKELGRTPDRQRLARVLAHLRTRVLLLRVFTLQMKPPSETHRSALNPRIIPQKCVLAVV